MLSTSLALHMSPYTCHYDMHENLKQGPSCVPWSLHCRHACRMVACEKADRATLLCLGVACAGRASHGAHLKADDAAKALHLRLCNRVVLVALQACTAQARQASTLGSLGTRILQEHMAVLPSRYAVMPPLLMSTLLATHSAPGPHMPSRDLQFADAKP